MDEENDDQSECFNCEMIVDEDELDEEGVCGCCRKAAQDAEELRSDYQFWTR